MSNKIITSLFLSLFVVGVLTSAAAGWYAAYGYNRFHEKQYAQELEFRARVVELSLGSLKDSLDRKTVEDAVNRANAAGAVRYAAVFPDGASASTSTVTTGGTTPVQPDVDRAFRGMVGISTSPGPALGIPVMHVALPVTADNRIAFVLRASGEVPPGAGPEKLTWTLLVGGLTAALAALGLAYRVSVKIAKPLSTLKEGTLAFAGGALEHRIFLNGNSEFRGLAETLQQMAANIDAKLRTALRERNEVEAVLSAMVEGVVAVDGELKIVRVNEAARRLFMIADQVVLRMPVTELVGDRRIVELLAETVRNRKEQETDVSLGVRWGSILHVHCMPLRGGEGMSEGAVAVINDVTRLRRLSNMRRDFVSSVSRQIKNPLHEIKGGIDRLAAGEIEDPREANDVLDFVEARVNLLNSTITSLLTLSRIEQFAETGMIVSQKHRVLTLLANAVQLSQPHADESEVTLEVECDENLWGEFDQDHLVIALVHLVDNAVSCSGPGSTVLLKAEKTDAALVLAVEDHGCGIEPQHAPHVFERFYRVERPETHGTGAGLGLTIVKRIVDAHGGEITFSTTRGSGTTFFIKLPPKGSTPVPS